jgi:hypothetical protein
MTQYKRAAVWIGASALAAGLLAGLLLLQELGNPFVVAGGSLLATSLVGILGGVIVMRD